MYSDRAGNPGRCVSRGAEIKQVFLVMSRHDTVLPAEPPNGEACARMCLEIGAAGNVHTETLHAFSEDEFRKIVSDIP